MPKTISTYYCLVLSFFFFGFKRARCFEFRRERVSKVTRGQVECFDQPEFNALAVSRISKFVSARAFDRAKLCAVVLEDRTGEFSVVVGELRFDHKSSNNTLKNKTHNLLVRLPMYCSIELS